MFREFLVFGFSKYSCGYNSIAVCENHQISLAGDVMTL